MPLRGGWAGRGAPFPPQAVFRPFGGFLRGVRVFFRVRRFQQLSNLLFAVWLFDYLLVGCQG